jgi:hypothetical protein
LAGFGGGGKDPFHPLRTPMSSMLSLLQNVVAVDEAFRTLLDNIFGSDIMEDYRKKRPAGYADLMNAFESRWQFFSTYITL